jgi:cellobiose phosphorylase
MVTDLFYFDDDERALVIRRPDTPTPWINYLSNGALHAFVSQAGGGMCWYKSPSIMRLTRYQAHRPTVDAPGFYLYIRPQRGPCWSPSFYPCATPLDTWEARHMPGRTRFLASRDALVCTLDVCIAPDYDALILDLALANEGPARQTLDLFGYVEFALLEWLRDIQWGCYVREQTRVWRDESLDALLYWYHADRQPAPEQTPLVFFGSTLPAHSFDCDRDTFIGPYRSERNPIALERGVCTSVPLHGGNPCGALHTTVTIEPGQTHAARWFLGAAPGPLVDYQRARDRAAAMLDALRDPSCIETQRRKLAAWWERHLETFSCTLPDSDAGRHIALWNPVQNRHVSRYCRSISPHTSGERQRGFRDSCQDLLVQAHRDPRETAAGLYELLGYQYEDGHVLHAVSHIEKRPHDESIRADNHLWPILLAHTLVAETGDPGVLFEHIDFLPGGGEIPPRASVWEHCRAAIRFTESHLGARGLPLILAGDWNDTIARFAQNGRGESTVAGMQYLYAVRLMLELAEMQRDIESIAWLSDCRDRMRAALCNCAWDSGQWLRGFDDDGGAIGAAGAPHGSLFLNPQSWAVICELGSPAQQRAGMDAVARQLQTPYGLRILAPAFDPGPSVADPLSAYERGAGENSAVFCHANAWAILAECLLGRPERAWGYYRALLPVNALRTTGVDRYQAQPNVWVSSLLGPENVNAGRASVGQLTGTAAWMEIAANEYLLGVRPELGGLRIDPRIPADWEGFTVRRRFRDAWFACTIENPGGGQSVERLELNGQALDCTNGPIIPESLIHKGEQYDVRAVMSGPRVAAG